MKQSTLVKQSLLTTSTCQPPQANTNCSDNGCEKPAEGGIKEHGLTDPLLAQTLTLGSLGAIGHLKPLHFHHFNAKME